MNHDDNKPDIRSLIEPELEARVVAWVSGEASAFEVAELERLVGEKPELGIFKRRIEAVRGLVAEAIRPDPQPLLLSPERRAKLLQAIGASEAVPPASVIQPLAAAKRAQRKDRRWMYAVAACLVAGLFTMMVIPSFKKVRQMSPVKAALIAGNSEPAVTGNLPVILNPESIALPAEGALERQRADRTAKKEKVSSFVLKQEAMTRASEQEAAKRRDFRYSLNNPAPASAPVVFGRIANNLDGYNSSSTLAGSRLDTELKDVGSSVTVVTSQFLRDTKAKSGEDGLTYGTATATRGGTSHYYNNGNTTNDLSITPAAPAAREPVVNGPPAAAAAMPAPPSFGGKEEQVLALSPFEVSADSDQRYRGPNSILYGTGSPAGTINTSVNDAAWSDSRLAASKPANEFKKSDDSRIEEDKALPATPQPAEAAFPEVSAAKEPVSTFSLHVSDVSFRLAQAALAHDEPLDRERIRPEEFYNAFDYGDPNPALAEKVSCRIEQAAHPFLQQRNLVRVALKVAASGRDAAQPLRLTVLLDTSGSMEREDRVAIVQRALASLLSLLGPNDRLTLIGFARQPRLLVESLPGDQAGSVLDIVAHTPAEGGTNLEEALKLGHELARRQFEPAAQNRVVLLTDGAANLGNARPGQLAAAVEALRQQGIAFDACGVGLEGLDDAMLETLTRRGDGRYYVLNSPEAADANFAQQLAGAFRPAAENVKLQVRFNPARVGHYRLIGFEQHRLREEDFRNDQVDAAELAAEEAAVAVYQVETLPQGEGELGEIYVRFRDAASGNMVERSWPLAYDAHSPAFDRASPSMQLAGSAALFAEILRGGEAEASAGLGELVPLMNRLRNHYAHEPRVQELVTMFEQARRLAGE